MVISAAFLTSAASGLVGAEGRNQPSPGSGTTVVDANRYYIDTLFRSQSAASSNEPERAEVSLIFAHALGQREFPPEDKNYVAEKVIAATGLGRPEAEKRVTEIFERDQQVVNTARKAVAHVLYWLFVAMLLGAFSASLAATFGGKQRDHIPTASTA